MKASDTPAPASARRSHRPERFPYSIGGESSWPVLLLLAALNLALYAPSLDNGFSLDDFNWLERAAHRTSTTSFVFESEPGQIVNPVPRVLFLSLFEAAGLEPLPYRLVVLALHVLAAFLLFHLVVELSGNRRIGAVAAVLFSLHTAHDEALFWVAAFFHPLVGVLTLGTFLFFVRFVRAGGRASATASGVLLLAGCLTKASAFSVLLPLGCWLLLCVDEPARQRRGARLLAGMTAIVLGAVLINVALGVGDSYLLERGYYRLGPHLVGNLAHYSAWLIFPFFETFELLGLASAYDTGFELLRWVAPVALIALSVAGDRRVRILALFVLASLLPFLPFVLAPVSRYTYLATAGVAGMLALLLASAARRWGRRPFRVGAGIALAGLLLVAAADIRLRDNHYEHRERTAAGWVADVSRALPAPPPGVVLEIVGLPRLAIDPGIHLEAALRLHYRDPALRVRVLDAPVARSPGAVRLEYREGRLLP